MALILLAAVPGLLLGWQAARIALAARLAGRFDVAGLRRAMAFDPGNADYPHRLGLLDGYSLGRANLSDAVRVLRKATELNPREAQYWSDLAEVCDSTGDAACSNQAAERALQLSPATPRFEWKAANHFIQEGRVGEALGRFRRLLAFVLPLPVASALLSGSRGGLVSLLTEAALLGWILWRRSGGSGSRVRAMLPVGLAAAALLFFWMAPNRLVRRLADLATTARDTRITLAERELAARDTLRIFRDYPWMGIGLGSFDTAFPQYRSFPTDLGWAHAHNDYAEALAETGLAGGALIVLALAMFFRLAFKKTPPEGRNKPPGCGWARAWDAAACWSIAWWTSTCTFSPTPCGLPCAWRWPPRPARGGGLYQLARLV